MQYEQKGDGYDNAAMERWNHSDKLEAVHGKRFPTRAEARQHTFEYIEAVVVNKDVRFFMLPFLLFRQRFRPCLLAG